MAARKIIQDNRFAGGHMLTGCLPMSLLSMPTALPRITLSPVARCDYSLSLACAMGLLAGSLAIDAQFTPLESQGLSAIVFSVRRSWWRLAWSRAARA